MRFIEQSKALTTTVYCAGLPPMVAALLISFETATAQGLLGEASPAVADLTGRAPQSVRDFLTTHKAALSNA